MRSHRRSVRLTFALIAVVVGVFFTFVLGEMRSQAIADGYEGRTGRWIVSSHTAARGESIVFLLDSATGDSWRFDGGLGWSPLVRR